MRLCKWSYLYMWWDHLFTVINHRFLPFSYPECTYWLAHCIYLALPCRVIAHWLMLSVLHVRHKIKLILSYLIVSYLILSCACRTSQRYFCWWNVTVCRVMQCDNGGLAYALVDIQPWWRHQMETFSALLALCAENSPCNIYYRKNQCKQYCNLQNNKVVHLRNKVRMFRMIIDQHYSTLFCIAHIHRFTCLHNIIMSHTNFSKS